MLPLDVIRKYYPDLTDDELEKNTGIYLPVVLRNNATFLWKGLG